MKTKKRNTTRPTNPQKYNEKLYKLRFLIDQLPTNFSSLGDSFSAKRFLEHIQIELDKPLTEIK